MNLSIFTNPKLDNTMKIMYISSTTTGEARQMAETLIARGNTAEQIWEIFIDTYEDIKKCEKILLNEARNFPGVKSK